MDRRADVLVIGYGPVGILKSYILENSGQVRVTALARTNAAACSQGVRIESADPKICTVEAFRPFRLVDSLAEANDRTYSTIFVATKCLPELGSTSHLLAPFLANSRPQLPAVVLLQNGVGIEAELRTSYPSVILISTGESLTRPPFESFRKCAHFKVAAIYMSANVSSTQPFTITSGRLSRTIFGLYRGEPGEPAKMTPEERRLGEYALSTVVNLFHAGGWDAETADNVYVAKFVKNLFNCTLSGICAICRTPGAGAFEREENAALLVAMGAPLADELLELARALGLGEDLVPADTKMQILQFLGKFQPSFRPTMHVDLESGRLMELEPIVGYFVRKGAELKLSMPNLNFMYTVLKVQQNVALSKILG